MSVELVGFENLPNVFIKEIMIFDYDVKQLEIKVVVRVHDMEDGSIWFDTSETLTQLLRIGLIMSTDADQSRRLTEGSISPTSVKSLTRSLPTPTTAETNLVFEVSFRKIIPRNTRHLNLYSFCFVDKVQVSEQFGFPLEQDYYGPIKSEKVLNNSNLFANTDVFVQDNGNYWAGPVHQNGGKYMVGSYHTDAPHAKLRKITITNAKIKDFRGIEGRKSQTSDSANNFLSNLTISYNSDTDINSMFMLNVKTLLKNYTKYGSFLNRTTPSAVSLILQSFRISLMTIQRQRIKVYNQSTRLRSKKQSTQSVFSRKNIIKTYDINGIIRNTTRLEKKGSFDVVESELRSNAGEPNRKKNEIFKEQLSDYKKISMIQELFFQYGEEIRTFQFNDYELTGKTPGKYKYKMELHFSDPIFAFLSNITRSMKQDLSDIKRYVALSSRARDLNNAGTNIQTLINSYVTYYSYVYELSQREKVKLSRKMFALLNPETATLKSTKSFQKQYEDLYTEFLIFLDLDPSKAFSKSERVSVLWKNQTTSRLMIDKVFNKIIEPSSNAVGFGYMGGSKASSMKIFSKQDIQDRGNEETSLLFTGQPNVDSPDLPTDVNTGLSDLSRTKTTYFSPTEMFKKASRIDLRKASSNAFDSINEAFYGVRAPQQSPFNGNDNNDKSTRSNEITVQEPTVPQNTPPEDTGETYVDSSDIIGSGQSFVSYTDVLDSYNVIDAQTGASKKVQNSATGYQNSRTFTATLENTLKLSGDQAAELPNPLKAVISGQSTATRTDYISSGTDLLANPKTKNYYELMNFSVQKLIYVDGFKQDRSGNILLNRPVYKTMILSNFQLTSKPVICFLEAYTNNSFNITDENKVSVVDSSFIMSDVDLTIKPTTATINNTPNYSTQGLSYEFMNSNLVKQTNQPINVEIQQTNDTPQATQQSNLITPFNPNANTFGSY